MFQNLDIFRLSHAMAVHAGARQAAIAQNMANADTPGYAARDLPKFASLIDTDSAQNGLRATRASHLNASVGSVAFEVAERRDVRSDPNGNAVSLETEMLHAVDVKRQHDRAIAIYKHALGVMRAATGRR